MNNKKLEILTFPRVMLCTEDGFNFEKRVVFGYFPKFKQPIFAFPEITSMEELEQSKAFKDEPYFYKFAIDFPIDDDE